MPTGRNPSHPQDAVRYLSDREYISMLNQQRAAQQAYSQYDSAAQAQSPLNSSRPEVTVSLPRAVFDAVVRAAHSHLTTLHVNSLEAVDLSRALQLMTSLPNGDAPVCLSTRVVESSAEIARQQARRTLLQQAQRTLLQEQANAQADAPSFWSAGWQATNPTREGRPVQRYDCCDTEPEDL